MGQSWMLSAYQDTRNILDKALEAQRGLRLVFSGVGETASRSIARRVMFRCYTVRARDRQRNARIYPSDHPLHGKSEYDVLSFYLEPAGEDRTALVIVSGKVGSEASIPGLVSVEET